MRRGPSLLCLLATILIAGGLSACSHNPAAPREDGSQPVWKAWANPQVYSISLTTIWGRSAGDVYAVGGSELILHYDGEDWALMHYGGNGAALNDVWASSPWDVYAVGSGGTILHYNGKNWKVVKSGTGEDLHGVWGRGADDVYVVGAGGTLLHYDGRRWKSVRSGTDKVLRDVWGDETAVFAVGDGGTLLEVTSTVARPISVGTTNDLYSIGGSERSGLWAVGDTGTTLLYTGRQWIGVRSGIIVDFKNVRGLADGHVLATTGSEYGGYVLYFDGSSWKLVDGASQGAIDAWGSSVNDFISLQSDDILHYSGTSWNEMELPVSDIQPPSLQDLWGSSGEDVYAVGEGQAALHFDGAVWTPVTGDVSTSANAICGFSQSEIVIARGALMDIPPPPPRGWEQGGPDLVCHTTIIRFDGTSWSGEERIEGAAINGIWGNTSTDIFAVGIIGKIADDWPNTWSVDVYPTILHWDGGTWSTMMTGDQEGSLDDVWGSSGTDVFAVGSGGAIQHYDGGAWTPMSSGASASLSAVWGHSGSDVFAVGVDGAIVHFDGTSWTAMESGTAEWLRDVWGSSATDVFAVGDRGTIIHYDGTGWTAMPSPTINNLYAVWGSGADRVFSVGQYGTILHYDRP